MLEVEGLTKYYRRHLAVDDVSFRVDGGEIVGLLGPNGAGKTTVLRSICGILKLSAGRVSIAGHSLQDQEIEAKRSIAFVPEVPNPYELLTVREHLRFVAMAYGAMDGVDERSNELLERLDLTEKRDDLVITLSKGMKQKLAVACGFIHDARVLLFDEPLIGIDPKGQRELRDMIAGARDRGCAVLISTHLLDTAERLCDRILILSRGRKLAEGTLEQLRQLVKERPSARSPGRPGGAEARPEGTEAMPGGTEAVPGAEAHDGADRADADTTLEDLFLRLTESE